MVPFSEVFSDTEKERKTEVFITIWQCQILHIFWHVLARFCFVLNFFTRVLKLPDLESWERKKWLLASWCTRQQTLEG